ncbi:hypothetical protein HMPREF9723_02153 [Treponema denticola OTK]|uniref:Uncharacterized protein n=1 Tax=Treponema denticola OTK TaxID=999434 RepID=A0A0F6MNB3_TREDN|nr:hypothetical protein [Treponema denticola]EMB20693.1 hypothetical protein HMPREF9723_02153 [Treponema denticola OTK]
MKDFNYKDGTSILEIFKDHKAGYYPIHGTWAGEKFIGIELKQTINFWRELWSEEWQDWFRFSESVNTLIIHFGDDAPVTLIASYHFSEEEPEVIFDICDSLLWSNIEQDNE